MSRRTSQLILSLIDRVTAPARRAAQSVRGITQAISEANGQRLRAMADANRQNIGRLRADLVDTAATAVALGFALSRPYAAAREFESVLEDIGQKANLSRRAQLLLGSSIRALGPQVNRSAQEIAAGVDVLAGFGLDPNQAVTMMRPIGRAATAYRAQIEDLARASFAAVDNLDVPFNQTSRALSVMAIAGKEGAFELRDMAQYFPSLTAAAAALGQTGTPAVADLAAALQIARKGAGDSAEAATNLSNVLQKINAPATRRKFAAMGVDLEASLRQAAERGLTPIEAIAEITNRTLRGDLSKIGDLFEDAQVQKGLRPIIQNLEEYRRIRAAAANGGDVVDQDFARRMQTSAAAADAFKAKIQNLAISFGTALLPAINGVLDFVGPFVDGLAQMTERFPGLTQFVVGTIASLIGLRLAALAFRFGKAQMLAGLADLGLGLIGFRGQLKRARGGIGGLASAGLDLALTLRRQVIGAFMATTLQAGIFTRSMRAGGLRGMAGGLLTMLNPLRMIRGALALTKLAFRGLLIGSGIGLLVLAAAWIIENWSKVKAFFAGFASGFMEAIAPVRPALQPLIDGISTVVGWVRQLLGDSGGSEGSWRGWGEAAGKAIGGVVVWIAQLIGGIANVIQKAGEMWARLRNGGQAPNLPTPRAGGTRPPGPGRPPAPGAAPRLAGARARGGHVRQGAEYLVGEEGPEIFKAGRSGTVYPNDQLQRAGSGRGGERRYTFAPQIGPFHVTGADAQTVFRDVMAQLRAEFRQFMGGIHADNGEFA